MSLLLHCDALGCQRTATLEDAAKWGTILLPSRLDLCPKHRRWLDTQLGVEGMRMAVRGKEGWEGPLVLIGSETTDATGVTSGA